jgi:hypothetical protein
VAIPTLRNRGRWRIGMTKGRGKIRISDDAIEAFLKSCEVASEDITPAPQRDRRPKPTRRTLSGCSDGKPVRTDWLN